jgi:RNA polymerase sigma-70 factor (ECF subfamily)
MDDDPRTDAALLAAATQDPHAFAVFYRRHVGWVLGYLGRRVPDRDAVADLTSEVFAAALVGVARFDPQQGAPGAWLFGIAAHHLARYRRRGAVERHARRRLGIPDLHLEDAELARIRSDDEVRQLLATLPAEQRDAVHRRIIEDQPYDQIAVELGVHEPVVRQRVSRGLRALRTRLRAEGERS